MFSQRPLMPLVSFLRSLFSLFGLLVLAALAYLVFSWWEGWSAAGDDGLLYRVRDDWRLWGALGLALFSISGRFIILPLITRPDSAPSRPIRGDGVMLDSPTGSRLYVEADRHGDGPVVIATHGWGLDSTIWSYLRRDLARVRATTPHDLIVWDLPGAGRSEAQSLDVISLTTFSRDLRALIDRVAPRPVILLGHSIGGMTIQTLARDYPHVVSERVAGIVLINTTYTNPLRTMILADLAQALRRPLLEPMFKLAILFKPLVWLSAWQGYFNGTAHLANRVQFAGSVTRSQLDHATLLGSRNSPAVLARGNLAMFDWDATAALVSSPCPVLVLGGRQDVVTKLEAGEAIAGQTPGAKIEAVEDANHMGFLEQSLAYNALIADFITERGASWAKRIDRHPAPEIDEQHQVNQ
jgi:pimeloyl-ACP methyl ester carboxylesterase